MTRRALLTWPTAAGLAWAGFEALRESPAGRPDLIERGLAFDRARHFEDAEASFLEAARLDHLYVPAWTLAGFYFRRSRVEDFWTWAKHALACGTRDMGALFDLCARVDPRVSAIWERAMPDRKEVWNEYLAYAIEAGKWDRAADAAGRLGTRASQQDVPTLLAFCDLAIEKGIAPSAVPAWNALAQRALIDAAPVHLLADPGFHHPPLGRGFSWKLTSIHGVRAEWTANPKRFVFSGLQPDECILLSQPLALEPNTHYRITTRATSEDVNLIWRVRIDGKPVGSTFQTPPVFRTATLELAYERRSGGVNRPGTYSLESVDITQE